MSENPNSAKENPVAASTFALDVQGLTSALFSEASGFANETEVITYIQQDSKGKRIYSKQPGNTKWNDITLKRGQTSDQELWNWRQQVLDGKIADARKNGTITGYDTLGNPVIQFTFQRGWISKWEGAGFDAKGNDVSIETITITHEGLDRTK